MVAPVVGSHSSAGSSDEHVQAGAAREQPVKAPSSASGSDEDAKKATTPRDETAVAAAPAEYQYNPGQRNLVHVAKRERFYQIWRPKELPPPPPLSLDEAKEIPLERAGIVSQFTFWWATPIMMLGYQRALEPTDLWKIGARHEAKVLSQKLLTNWERRVKEADEYNAKLEAGEIPVPAGLKLRWSIAQATGRGVKGGLKERERLWRAAPPKSEGTSDAAKKTKKQGRKLSGHVEPSLPWALLEQFKGEMVAAVLIKLVSDAAQMTSPLLIRVIITYAGKAYAHHQVRNAAPEIQARFPSPNVGEGVGYAVALFVLQIIQALGQHAFFFRSMAMGVHSRTAIISAIFTRALTLNGKDRSAGKLLNHASTDVSRIDFAFQWGLLMFSSPFALGLCLGLLIWQIGVAALAGFAVIFFAAPVQGYVMKQLFILRRKSMQSTDKRSKLINELLSSIRVVKSFAQENKFLQRISEIRRKELQGIRSMIIYRSAMMAVAFSLPVIASVVGFLVYAAMGNDLAANAETTGKIFTALTLFQLLRMPMMFLPLSFSAAADGAAAMSRLKHVFTAQQIEDKSEREVESKWALALEDASFTYDQVDPAVIEKKSKKQVAAEKATAKIEAKAEEDKTKDTRSLLQRIFKPRKNIVPAPEPQTGLPVPVTAASKTEAGQLTPAEHDEKAQEDTVKVEEPFSLKNLTLRVLPGELVAIVGPVGSGKSSIFQGLTGEMRQTGGRLVWGGSGTTAYAAQQPWVQAATVRENVLFGLPFDEERYWEVIRMAELEADLKILPQGDMTEIGEKGTTLSGGQKARVNLARALYFDADTYILDDPLSAVDPHVAKALFNKTILGLRNRGKTVLLVTHAIHVLPHCDRIITMLDGHIAEMGTFDKLAHANGPFQELMLAHGGEQQDEEEERKENEEEALDDAGKPTKAVSAYKREDLTDISGSKALMQQEERNTGSVAGKVYLAYFRAGRGYYMVPMIIISLVLMQGAVIMNSYTLTWWTGDVLGFPQTTYMGIYAGLGVSQALFTGFMGIATGFLSYYAAATIHGDSIQRIMFAPLSTFFDTTPKGRIMSRMGKDVDVLDNQLSDSFRMATSTIAQVIGAIILISYLTPPFLAAIGVLLCLYGIAAMVYRRSAREIKRIDALLRSSLYAHYSETLTGMSTVRAYGEMDRFQNDHYRHMDIQTRAYFFTIVNQRWLGIRLDFLGSILVFVVALLTTAGADSGISPGQSGLALSYILTVSQSFSWMTRQVAEVENDMNSAERLHHYATDLDQEAPQEVPEANLPAEWPSRGAIKIRDVELRYRAGLPIVLHGVSLDIKGGEKVAVCGRTGSGKSTMLSAFLRLVELEKGTIEIDGFDISKIGLRDLRTRIAVLPQEPTLFSGTLRSNLDPFNQYDDARLWDALKRSYLVDETSTHTDPHSLAPSGHATPVGMEPSDHHEHHKLASRFTLDTTIEEEGGNLSLGQRSLVSLARALVKDSQIILLDEATASVDVETDAKIQATIMKEFAGRTLITVAHRLRTILRSDRIAVFDDGKVAEFATPLELFDRGGIFTSMCEKANISREEVENASDQ